MRYIVLVIILYTTSCSQNKYNESTIKQEILEITSKYNKVWETLNVQKISEFHSNESFVYYWHGSLASSDNDHFKKLFPEILSSVKAWSIKKTSEPIVQVLSKDAAIISFTLEAEAIGLNGKKGLEPGALSYVWKKVDNNWKIVHIHDAPKSN